MSWGGRYSPYPLWVPHWAHKGGARHCTPGSAPALPTSSGRAPGSPLSVSGGQDPAWQALGARGQGVDWEGGGKESRASAGCLGAGWQPGEGDGWARPRMELGWLPGRLLGLGLGLGALRFGLGAQVLV